MGVWSKWIFPIVRLVIVTAIAVALVKIAFFPDTPAEGDPAQPTASIVDPTIPVLLGSISTNVSINGAVSADPAVDSKATLAGEVIDLSATVGKAVAAGDQLGTIRQEIPQEPITKTDADGNLTVTQPKPKYKTAAVTAAVAGTVSAVPIVNGQLVAVGDALLKVAPPTFNVTGSMKPEDQYKLVSQPTEAHVEVVGGPAGFACTGLTITAALAGAETPSDPSAPASGTGATVKCQVPAEVQVFGGLTATITIAGGSAENVLMLPITAVKGNSGSGTVWVIGQDGAQEERPVTLGLNDGTNVQIVDGVVENDEVLQFVPIADPTDPVMEGCIEQPDGSVYCDEEGEFVG